MAAHQIRHVADVETDFGDVPLVPCYPGELNQVFLNLLVNAAHAISDVITPERPRGCIRVRSYCEGNEVVASISDTGAGIPLQIQSRIFEPFFTTKEIGRGTGQGLSLARGIVVDKHNGRIAFETTPGVGTTFRVHLPVAASR
jgi:two-component system NtrC family sensor kinase